MINDLIKRLEEANEHLGGAKIHHDTIREAIAVLSEKAAQEVAAIEALRNMMGAFDNAVRRLKMPDPFCDEACESGRKALALIDNQQ